MIAKRLVENLQTDLRALSNETKRKYAPVKEVCFVLVIGLSYCLNVCIIIEFDITLLRSIGSSSYSRCDENNNCNKKNPV